jgi:hypothetical protein
VIPLIRILDEPSPRASRAGFRLVRSRNALVHALEGPTEGQIWILASERGIDLLIRALAEVPPRVRRAKVISYLRPPPDDAQVLESGFGHAFLGVQVMVDVEALAEILTSEHPEDYCIGAAWDEARRAIRLWRGDFSVLVVPLSTFPERAGVRADPARLSIEDSGQTVRLGHYEVAFTALLQERDPLHRRRAKKRLIRDEQSLGASIRRLRIARGLARTDFGDLDPRTLARIEQGEVDHPHQDTLDRIARRLGVRAEELAEY